MEGTTCIVDLVTFVGLKLVPLSEAVPKAKS